MTTDTQIDAPNSDMQPDPSTERMMKLITGSFVSQIVRAFAELSVADMMAERPMTADEISTAVHAEAGAIRRLLRAGITLGLVKVDGWDRFTSTSLLKTLERNSPASLRGLAIALASPGTWLPWGNFVAAVRSGERQTMPTLGMEYFDYLERTPTEAKFFSAGMASITNSVTEQAAKMIATQGLSVAADIGGASGALLHALLAVNPELHGVVYDRANVIPTAVEAAQRLGLGDRLSVVAGDFFESVPEADLYLLKSILHDWDDAACLKILTNCTRSMRPGGRIAVIERELGGMDDPGPASVMDLNMMVVLNGRERTVSEYRELFAAVGMRLTRVEPLHTPLGPRTLMEATND